MNTAKNTARLAGIVYFLLGATSYWGILCIPLVQDDVATLGRAVIRPGLQFRLHIVSDLISQISAVFLAWLLFRLLSPVGKRQAALMVGLFLVSVPISVCITLNDVAARILFNGPEFLAAFTRPQLNSLATVFLNLHLHGVFAVEAFWGLWLIPFGFLVIRSRFIPRVLGVMLVMAGAAYTLHSALSLLLPGRLPAIYQSVTMVARAAGELPMIFWLLIVGVRAIPSPERPSPAA